MAATVSLIERCSLPLAIPLQTLLGRNAPLHRRSGNPAAHQPCTALPLAAGSHSLRVAQAQTTVMPAGPPAASGCAGGGRGRRRIRRRGAGAACTQRGGHPAPTAGVLVPFCSHSPSSCLQASRLDRGTTPGALLAGPRTSLRGCWHAGTACSTLTLLPVHSHPLLDVAESGCLSSTLDKNHTACFDPTSCLAAACAAAACAAAAAGL